MAVLYIAPSASGLGDGSSWANAGSLVKISNLIKAAGAGGTVLLRADQGSFHLNTGSIINVSTGGAVGAPVTIRGADVAGNPMSVVIESDRDPAWMPGKADGGEIFRLLNGANNLTFSDMTFRNVGDGAFRLAANNANITIEDIHAYNVRTLVLDRAATNTGTASVSGLTIRDVDVHGFSRGVVALKYDSHDIVIDHVTGDSEHQDGDNFAMGVHLDGTVHNVLISNTTMINDWATNYAYWNGDGFTTEDLVYNVRFEHTAAIGNADSGYDIKSASTILVDAYAAENKRNFRFHNTDTVLQDSQGVDPIRFGGAGSQAQVWLDVGAKAKIVNSSFTDSSAATFVFDLENWASLTVVGGSVSANALAKVIKIGTGATFLYTPVLSLTSLGTSLLDNLIGTSAADNLKGMGGADTLIGGMGADTLTGGTGADQFRYDSLSAGGDVISDFLPGTDKIALSSIAFGVTSLADLHFVNGLTPTLPGEPAMHYDAASGQLLWDPTGDDVGDAILLATLTNHPLLSITSFKLF